VKAFRAEVRVTPREGLLDPQGDTVRAALEALGFEGLAGVRIGKLIRIELQAPDAAEAERRVREMCDRLLANPVTEDYEVRVEAAPGPASARARVL
jgi:phosphoribosylformylglycinamidine synthase PurS subunit